MLRLHTRWKVALAILAAGGALAPRAAAGDPAAIQAQSATSPSRARAAKLYDRALALYEQAKYAEAARAFLEADELAPSSDALASAIAAARIGHDHLLVAQAAERAIARESSDAKLAGDARAALAEAEVHLARLDLACHPTPCSVSIESKAVQAGRHYLLPGTHLLGAAFAGGKRIEQRAALAAGSLHTITLTEIAANAAGTSAEVTAAAPGRPSAERSASPPGNDRGRTKPLPAWTFYAGVAGSVLLGGLTIWSGLDALDDVDRFESTRRGPDRSVALSSIQRTDILLGGTVVLTGITVYAGLRWTDFGSSQQALGIAPARGGALVSWSGQL